MTAEGGHRRAGECVHHTSQLAKLWPDTVSIHPHVDAAGGDINASTPILP